MTESDTAPIHSAGARSFNVGECAVLKRSEFPQLINALKSRDYIVVGPVVGEGAIIYDELDAEDLPAGWTDEQDGGKYLLKRRQDNALFGYAVGPHSWKKFLFPPVTKLWSARRAGEAIQIEHSSEKMPKYAFLGVRSCELHAIEIQDKVFMGKFVDPGYKIRREQSFIVAVNCSVAGGTCFCVSMNTGPKATKGFDLALTEIIQGADHYFTVEVGTEKGAEILTSIECQPASQIDISAADEVSRKTALSMGRSMQSADVKELLYRNYEHPRWDDVASRCLTCANCTLVCPTCFCSSVEDTTDLTGEHAERWRKWDSCFTMDFSYLDGSGSVRASARSRYRQWMTHKLATWIDQFGTSGCVGCGRCITWCPVGIDITEEVRAIRDTEKGRSPGEEARYDCT